MEPFTIKKKSSHVLCFAQRQRGEKKTSDIQVCVDFIVYSFRKICNNVDRCPLENVEAHMKMKFIL